MICIHKRALFLPSSLHKRSFDEFAPQSRIWSQFPVSRTYLVNHWPPILKLSDEWCHHVTNGTTMVPWYHHVTMVPPWYNHGTMVPLWYLWYHHGTMVPPWCHGTTMVPPTNESHFFLFSISFKVRMQICKKKVNK